MIHPHEVEEISRQLIELYQQIENDLVTNIAKRFSLLDQIDPYTIADWQVDKLQQLGALHRENVRAINRLSGKTQKEIERILAGAGYQALEYDERIYQEAFAGGLLPTSPLPLHMSPMLEQILNGAIANTRSAFNMINTTALQSAQMEFLNIINQTYLETSLGITDYNTAVRKATRNLSDKGITGADYISAAGRRTRNHIDVAVRRAIITSAVQTAAGMQIERAKEWGSNLVEVSSHLGARPSHAVWQGAIYSINGGTAEYPNLAAVTGYGTVTGLCGANCRHIMFPFFEGFSEQAHKPYDLEENQRVYEDSQEMRRLEREVRKEKRRILTAEEIGDADGKFAAQLKLKEKEAKLKQFARNSGQGYQSNRTQSYGFGRSEASKAVWAQRKAHPNQTNQ
jgi:hypothetical protein